MLSFLLARDTMHQNQWLAAIAELEADGLETTPCPSSFPQEHELSSVAYQYMSFSRDGESRTGRWANGVSMDGRGEFEYVENPVPMGDVPILEQGDPLLHGTLREVMEPAASGPSPR